MTVSGGIGGEGPRTDVALRFVTVAANGHHAALQQRRHPLKVAPIDDASVIRERLWVIRVEFLSAEHGIPIGPFPIVSPSPHAPGHTRELRIPPISTLMHLRISCSSRSWMAGSHST